MAGGRGVKKLINAVDDFVLESVEGMCRAHPDLVAYNADPVVVYRVDTPRQGKVGIISGGGSGHEPMHGGFVGTGMLDAACPGAVFTSPTPDQMQWATEKVDGGAGVLHIVKNYSGDVMNFEMAAELAEGIRVESVVIDDDVAVKDSLYTQGRRGVGGTVLLEKIVGASAEEGASLDTVTDLARDVIANVRSMGLALTSCVVPAAGTPTFEIGDDEVEIGIGIHGEPGRERIKMESADQLTDRITNPVIEDLGLTSGDRALVFVNSMGGTPLAELYVVYRRVAQLLDAGGVEITRSLVGPYITSLEMQGASVTILRLDDEKTRLWDAPVNTPGLRWRA
jgi:dihydroxyacetone kinase-like protein